MITYSIFYCILLMNVYNTNLFCTLELAMFVDIFIIYSEIPTLKASTLDRAADDAFLVDLILKGKYEKFVVSSVCMFCSLSFDLVLYSFFLEVMMQPYEFGIFILELRSVLQH